ncbi:primase-helicase family protein [Aeoliella sp. SH292]|uniref:primase-helicase family protein n=1 Tax=Aeoliella sp. SH292 TaxID=3454464 RepID=UPI003F9785B5
MKVRDFILREVPDTEQFRRARELDVSRMDFTMKVQGPAGNEYVIRVPRVEATGAICRELPEISKDAKLLNLGTAGWDYVEQQVTCIGIDIDTDDNHASGLDQGRFESVFEAVKMVPWLEVRRSSGGKGLHCFAHVSEPVKIGGRKESSALALAVLEVASRITGCDLKAAKDCAGGNLWIYKADAAPNAFEVIKPATDTLNPTDLPPGWRDLEKSKRSQSIRCAPSTVELSPAHLQIQDQVQAEGFTFIYVPELGCFHTHTKALEQAAKKHSYRGLFRTNSAGTDPGTPNCHMWPLPGGAFLVMRFGDAQEDTSWYRSPKGAYAYLNVSVPFDKAVHHFAKNNSSKGYEFGHDALRQFLEAIGVAVDVPEMFGDRKLFVKQTKDEARITVAKGDTDGPLEDWTVASGTWQRSFLIPPPDEAFAYADSIRASEVVRAVSNEAGSDKWFVRNGEKWIGTNAGEVKNVLVYQSIHPASAMGRMRQEPYELVYEPVKPEYLDGKRWNRGAPQLACEPADVALDTPTWDALFEHIGKGLDEDVAADPDCQRLGITTGADYLRIWVKLLIERPSQRTPYLFLYSRENNTGKSTFAVSLSYLINPGVAEINQEAFTGTFTSELEGKVLCLIEELDLRDSHNKAYAMLKRILTSPTLTIRRMRTDAYEVPNFTHFIHTANDANFVPCESNDVRLVMIGVSRIEEFIEQDVLNQCLRDEAPSMLRKLFDMPLPERCGRFWLPVVQTTLKESVIAGVHDDEVTPAQEGVAEFAKACLVGGAEHEVQTSEVLAGYTQFCTKFGFPEVPKTAFLKTLKEAVSFPIGPVRQKRVDGIRKGHYRGFTLRSSVDVLASTKQTHLSGDSLQIGATNYALSC